MVLLLSSKLKLKLSLSVLALLLIVVTVYINNVEAWSLFGTDKTRLLNPLTFPNPTDKDDFCNHTNKGFSFLCDPLNYIKSDEEKSEIEEYTYVIEKDIKSTTCVNNNENGYQVAIAITNTVDKNDNDPNMRKVENFARALHNHWGVGSEKCNDGILVFLAVKDRSVYISRGSGVEEKLTKQMIESMISEMKVYLRQEEYGKAILLTVNNIGKALVGQYEVESYRSSDGHGNGNGEGDIMVLWIFLGFFGVFILLALIASHAQQKQQGRYNEARRILDRIQQDHDDAITNVGDGNNNNNNNNNNKDIGKYETKSCSICLEDLPQEKKEKRYLLCGHVYCKSCLDEWMTRQTSCPVCRKDVVSAMDDVETVTVTDTTTTTTFMMDNSNSSSSETSATTAVRRATSTASSYYRVRSTPEFFAQERNFRLNQLRNRYPDIVTPTMVENWSNSAFAGRMSQENTFLRAAPSYRDPNARRATNSTSSPRSFGGGRSSGGGGGKW